MFLLLLLILLLISYKFFVHSFFLQLKHREYVLLDILEQ